MTLEIWKREFRESTRGELANLLRGGPATVEELAGSLGLTNNAVRSHLQTLSRDGLVQSTGVRRTDGAGKPANLYELTTSAESAFSEAYFPVLEALLVAVATLGPKTREQVIRRAAREIASKAAVDQGTEGTPGVRAAKILERLGALVDVVPTDRGEVLQGKGCPVSLLTGRHPAVCDLVRLVISEATGMQVREECDRGKRPQCRFALSKEPPILE